MMKTWKKLLPLFVVVLLGSTAMSSAQAGACLSAVEIQNAISSGQILPLDQILARAGLSKSDLVGRFSVCDNGGTLFYELPTLSGGKAQTLILNAHTGGS